MPRNHMCWLFLLIITCGQIICNGIRIESGSIHNMGWSFILLFSKLLLGTFYERVAVIVFGDTAVNKTAQTPGYKKPSN